MAHSWGFIFFLLGLAGFVILCLAWKCWGSPRLQEQENINWQEAHQRNVSESQDSQIPVAIKRKKNNKERLEYEKELDEYKAPILKRRSRSRSNKAEYNSRENEKSQTSNINIKKGVEKKSLAHCSEFDPENDDFYKLLDKREAKRKLLQKENEERLSKLLDMKHIFSTTQINYRTLDRKITERQVVLKKGYSQVPDKRNDHQSKKEFRITTIDHSKTKQESETPKQANHNSLEANVLPEKLSKTSKEIEITKPMSEIPVPEKRNKRRYSEPNNVGILKPRISKVINFVAITVNESAPKHERKTIKENPVPTSRHIDCPRKHDPIKPKRIYYSLPNKKLKIETAKECTDHVREEYVGVIAGLEQLRAAKVCEDDKIKEKIFVEVPEVKKLARDVSPILALPKRRLSEDYQSSTLQFTSVRRNFITDTLFAGNIYVGHQVEDTTENIDTDDNREIFSSWRQRFEQK